ncbi:serine/threonine protein kinase [Hyalangium gracile]|uniref:serine/threonine protein kinase n=1 Tax=Hyalangium gracile TaxID=394092 RepID=UPI001CC9B518|nr:protein kinase [Hyalangium gracile]
MIEREAMHAELVPGMLVGPWLIRARHDRGSFGVVFRAQRAGHSDAGPFALKVAVTPDDPRFTREVALLQSLQHSSVPRFEDRGWWDSPSSGAQYPYLVMEWVEGVPLYEWARGARRTSRQVLLVLEQIASALAAAHALGGVHRDVKGDNVLVTAGGRAVLLDWGCAVHRGATPVTENSLGPGTTSYRSPESLRWHWAHRLSGERYEPRGADDVYALGVTAYRLVTGTYPPPFEEVSGPPRRLFPPKDFATVSSGLDALLLACLAEEPLRRPRASSLAAALGHAAQQPEASAPIEPTPNAADTDRASNPGPQRRRAPWLPAGAALATVALLVGGALVLRHLPPRQSGSFAEVVQEGPSRDAPDAGVGDTALVATSAIPQDVIPYTILAARFPKTPFPGQKKAPCIPRFEREVLGVCWSILEGKPPCDSAGYEYEGKCLRAVIEGPRQPTSGEP